MTVLGFTWRSWKSPRASSSSSFEHPLKSGVFSSSSMFSMKLQPRPTWNDYNITEGIIGIRRGIVKNIGTLHVFPGRRHDRPPPGKRYHPGLRAFRLLYKFGLRIGHRHLGGTPPLAVIRGQRRRFDEHVRRDVARLRVSDQHVGARHPLSMEPEIVGPRELQGKIIVSRGRLSHEDVPARVIEFPEGRRGGFFLVPPHSRSAPPGP